MQHTRGALPATMSAAKLVVTGLFAGLTITSSVALPPREFSELSAPSELAALVARGEQMSSACVSCHTFDRDGAHRGGPNLWNIVGESVAAREGYRYSAALEAYRGEWTYERLESFLISPSSEVSGTTMGTFYGLRRNEVWPMIAYLRTLTDGPLAPLPSAAWVRAEDITDEQAEPEPPPDFPRAPANSTARRDVLRRGFQIHHDVCSSCHAMGQLRFARLSEPGGPEWSEEEVLLIAAGREIEDRSDEAAAISGIRPGRPSDQFPSPFATSAMALAANGGLMPPDFSSVLSGNQPPPFIASVSSVYDLWSGGRNRAREQILAYLSEPVDYSAAPNTRESRRAWCVLQDEMVLFQDGGRTAELMARDVVAFLDWADAGGDWRSRRIQAIRIMLVWITVLGAIGAFVLAHVRMRRWLNRHR